MSLTVDKNFFDGMPTDQGIGVAVQIDQPQT